MTMCHPGGPSVSVLNLLAQRHQCLAAQEEGSSQCQTFAFLENLLNASRCQKGALEADQTARKPAQSRPRRILNSTQSLPTRNPNSQKRIMYVSGKGKKDILQQSLTRDRDDIRSQNTPAANRKLAITAGRGTLRGTAGKEASVKATFKKPQSQSRPTTPETTKFNQEIKGEGHTASSRKTALWYWSPFEAEQVAANDAI